MPRREEWLKHRDETGRCDVCLVEMDKHLVCSSCGIMIGYGHISQFLIDGKCPTCKNGRIYSSSPITKEPCGTIPIHIRRRIEQFDKRSFIMVE